MIRVLRNRIISGHNISQLFPCLGGYTMEKPLLENYGLTQKDLDHYLEQKKLFEQEYEKHLASNEKISFFITWIISSIIIFIIMLLVDHAIFEGKIWLIFVVPISALFFPTFLIIAIMDGPYQFLNRREEIKAQYFSVELEKKCIEYEKALKEYDHYLDQINKNYWIQMTGLEFEKEVASLFRGNGYNATLTPATADGGVDIILIRGDERIAVQCKHHVNPVGPNDVRALQGVVASQNYSKGIFVSLNGYTATVRQEVRSGNVQIELLELKDILQMAKGSHENSLKDSENVSRKTDLRKKPRLGDIVTHKTFGEGIIIEIVQKDNNETYLTIDFVHSVKKFVFPNSFIDDHLAFKKISENEVFREYSFNGYWMFAREEYKKVLTIFPNDNKDYFHLINGLKEVMKIENLDFKALVINFEKIRPEYYYGGKRFEISQQKGLLGAITTFESYITSIREQRLSIKGFYDFLIKESNDNEIYLSNKRSDGESIVETLLNKNPIDKLIPEHIEIYIERIQYILSIEKIDIACLARYSACASRSEFIEKYPIYDEPSTDTVLEWLTRYYKKTITTI